MLQAEGRINKDTVLFVVSKSCPQQDDTIELRIRMVAGKNETFKIDRPLNLDQFLVKHFKLSQ